MKDIILKILESNKDKIEWSELLTNLLPVYEVNTNLRLAHFFSQCCHESNDFKITEENLNYSAQGLLKIFSKYFKDETTAKQYEKQPMKIANLVYANRMGNGDTNSGDGYKYRGRGIIQLTGKDNYKKFSQDVFNDNTVLDNPDTIIINKAIAVHSACWFWQKNNLNSLADKDDCLAITKKINGGINGLQDRQERLMKYKLLFV
jgi:putative chitinase